MTTAFVGPHPRRCPMRKTLVFTTVTIAALVAARWQARAPISFAAAEQIRLRAHFDSVERELRARDVPGLTPAQRAARTRLLDILHRYQVRGVFPQNIDFPDRDVPVFIDWRGTRCGFAYLIELPGRPSAAPDEGAGRRGVGGAGARRRRALRGERGGARDVCPLGGRCRRRVPGARARGGGPARRARGAITGEPRPVVRRARVF